MAIGEGRLDETRQGHGASASPRATRVVKVGGRAQSDPALGDAIARAWAARPGALVVVHGGGDEVSRLQRLMGAEPRFVDGRRVTTAEDLETLRMALSGSANKRLVSMLVAKGLPALGLSGEDAGLLVARRTGDALGEVGTPSRVNAELLAHLLGGGFLPVLSPVSARERGAGALNVNGDDAAAAIAAALGADELLLVADVPGVLVAGEPVAQLSAEAVAALVANGDVRGGMIAKLDAATASLAAGFARVRIGDVGAIADASRGTVVASAATLTEPPAATLRGALPLHA